MNRYIVADDSMDVELTQVKKMLRGMPVLVQTIDSDNCIEYVNDHWLALLEYEESEVLGELSSKFLTESSRLKSENIFEKLCQDGFCDNIDYQFVAKSGKILDVALSATAIKDEEGKFLRYFAILTNNTENKATIRENHELEQRLSLALDASRIGIWEWKIPEDELIWEDQMYSVYGCNKEDFSHAYEAWEKVIHPDDRGRISEEVQKTLGGHGDFDTEFRAVDSESKVRQIRARAVVTRCPKGKPLRMIGANWDVSKEKELLEELQSEQIKMLHAARLASVGEMAAGIAHEINNPLMVVKTKIEFIKYLLNQNVMERSQFLEIAGKIDNMINRISSIVTGLKNFSRQGFSTKLEEESFGKIIDESLDFFMTKLTDEGIRIDLDEIDRGLRFKTQPLLLSQVILNLVQNARDAICDNDDPWVKVSAKKLSDKIEIRVTDCGNGIPEDLRERVFNPFYTTKAIGKGTGLGLSLSKSIIEGLDGQLYLDTQSSNTSFVIEF